MQYATATAGTASATDRGKAKPAVRWGKIGGAGGLKGVTCDASGGKGEMTLMGSGEKVRGVMIWPGQQVVGWGLNEGSRFFGMGMKRSSNATWVQSK